MGKRCLIGAVAGALAFAASGVAEAETMLDGTFTLGYTNANSDAGDYSGVTLGFSSEFSLGGGFRAGLDVDLARFSDDATNAELDLNRFAIEPRYHFSNGLVLGAYVQRSSAEIGNAGFLTGLDGHIDSYGAVLGFERDSFEIDGYFGMSEVDPDLPGTDITDMGFGIAYDATPNLHLSGQFARTRVEAGGAEADIDLFGFAAAYSVTSDLTVFGAYGTLDISNTPIDAQSVSFGLGYDLAAIGPLPEAKASLEYARSSGDIGGASADVDIVRFGISFPIGDGASSVPLNSSARSFGGGVRTALPSVVLGGF